MANDENAFVQLAMGHATARPFVGDPPATPRTAEITQRGRQS